MFAARTRALAASTAGLRAAAAAAALPALPAAPVSALAASAAAMPLASVFARSVHMPRRIRGVGPAPRKASFYRQPWLRRRLALVRKQHWPATHGATPTLSQPVQQAQQQAIQVQARNLETAEQTGSVSLDPAVFGVPLRRDIIWSVVRWQRACRRQGSHKQKDRSEVFGSGKKQRPQKGSGRARMGDKHAPHHVGGGHAFPRRPTSYKYDLPRPVIALGKRVALSAKAAEGNLFVVDSSSLSSAHTQAFLHAMRAHRWGHFLMVHLDGELDPNLAIAARSSPHFDFLSERDLNVYDIVKAKRLVLTRKALEAIQWRLNKKNVAVEPKADSMRFMVGSFGGGYTRSQVQFVKPGTSVAEGRVVKGVDVDGLQLVVPDQPYTTPIHWP